MHTALIAVLRVALVERAAVTLPPLRDTRPRHRMAIDHHVSEPGR